MPTVIDLIAMEKGYFAQEGIKLETVKELDGKVLATPGPGTIQNSHLLFFARRQGFKFKPVYGQGMAQVLALFDKRDVVAFVGWEPFAAVAVARMNGK